MQKLKILGGAITGALLATPAFATTAPIPVPEPTTMTLAAVASAGVVLAYRLFR